MNLPCQKGMHHVSMSQRTNAGEEKGKLLKNIFLIHIIYVWNPHINPSMLN